jgi:hypothetical protein
VGGAATDATVSDEELRGRIQAFEASARLQEAEWWYERCDKLCANIKLAIEQKEDVDILTTREMDARLAALKSTQQAPDAGRVK